MGDSKWLILLGWNPIYWLMNISETPNKIQMGNISVVY